MRRTEYRREKILQAIAQGPLSHRLAASLLPKQVSGERFIAQGLGQLVTYNRFYGLCSKTLLGLDSTLLAMLLDHLSNPRRLRERITPEELEKLLTLSLEEAAWELSKPVAQSSESYLYFQEYCKYLKGDVIERYWLATHLSLVREALLKSNYFPKRLEMITPEWIMLIRLISALGIEEGIWQNGDAYIVKALSIAFQYGGDLLYWHASAPLFESSDWLLLQQHESDFQGLVDSSIVELFGLLSFSNSLLAVNSIKLRKLIEWADCYQLPLEILQDYFRSPVPKTHVALLEVLRDISQRSQEGICSLPHDLFTIDLVFEISYLQWWPYGHISTKLHNSFQGIYEKLRELKPFWPLIEKRYWGNRKLPQYLPVIAAMAEENPSRLRDLLEEPQTFLESFSKHSLEKSPQLFLQSYSDMASIYKRHPQLAEHSSEEGESLLRLIKHCYWRGQSLIPFCHMPLERRRWLLLHIDLLEARFKEGMTLNHLEIKDLILFESSIQNRFLPSYFLASPMMKTHHSSPINNFDIKAHPSILERISSGKMVSERESLFEGNMELLKDLSDCKPYSDNQRQWLLSVAIKLLTQPKDKYAEELECVEVIRRYDLFARGWPIKKQIDGKYCLKAYQKLKKLHDKDPKLTSILIENGASFFDIEYWSKWALKGSLKATLTPMLVMLLSMSRRDAPHPIISCQSLLNILMQCEFASYEPQPIISLLLEDLFAGNIPIENLAMRRLRQTACHGLLSTQGLAHIIQERSESEDPLLALLCAHKLSPSVYRVIDALHRAPRIYDSKRVAVLASQLADGLGSEVSKGPIHYRTEDWIFINELTFKSGEEGELPNKIKLLIATLESDKRAILRKNLLWLTRLDNLPWDMLQCHFKEIVDHYIFHQAHLFSMTHPIPIEYLKELFSYPLSSLTRSWALRNNWLQKLQRKKRKSAMELLAYTLPPIGYALHEEYQNLVKLALRNPNAAKRSHINCVSIRDIVDFMRSYPDHPANSDIEMLARLSEFNGADTFPGYPLSKRKRQAIFLDFPGVRYADLGCYSFGELNNLLLVPDDYIDDFWQLSSEMRQNCLDDVKLLQSYVKWRDNSRK